MAETLDRTTLAELLEMVGDDPEFVAELVDTYLADARDLLAEMGTAADSGDAEAMLRPAHTLKGNSLNLGATRLAEISRGLEEQARRGSLDGAEEQVAAAEAEFVRVADALEAARAAGWSA